MGLDGMVGERWRRREGERERETRTRLMGGGLMDDGELVDSNLMDCGWWMVWILGRVDSALCGRPVDVAKTGVEQPIGPSQGYSPRSCG